MTVMQASAEPTVWHYIFLPFLLLAFLVFVGCLLVIAGALIHGPWSFTKLTAKKLGKEAVLIGSVTALFATLSARTDARSVQRQREYWEREILDEDPDDEGDPEAGR